MESVSTPRASPAALITSLQCHHHLLGQMIKRDIQARYRGSTLGLLWSFITPLMMLMVYTFVFGVVFQARFGTDAANPEDHNTTAFALTLFCGLMVHALFSESLTRSPSLILHHVNYVKKVVFPLEILPIMLVSSACFHFLMSFMVLSAGLLVTTHSLPLTLLYVPIIVLPMLMLMLGISWVLASLGVYLRDIGQLMGLVSTLLLFLSPVFYPVEALPEKFRFFLYFNPLTPMIEQMRQVIIEGVSPDWHVIGIYYLLAAKTLASGFWWFQKTRKGFADIL